MKYCTMGTAKEEKKMYFDELHEGDVFRFVGERADGNIYMRLNNDPDTDEMRFIDLDDGVVCVAFNNWASIKVEVYNGRIEFLENEFSTERR